MIAPITITEVHFAYSFLFRMREYLQFEIDGQLVTCRGTVTVFLADI